MLYMHPEKDSQIGIWTKTPLSTNEFSLIE